MSLAKFATPASDALQLRGVNSLRCVQDVHICCWSFEPIHFGDDKATKATHLCGFCETRIDVVQKRRPWLVQNLLSEDTRNGLHAEGCQQIPMRRLG